MGLKLFFLFVWIVIGTMVGLMVSKSKKESLKYYESFLLLLNKLSLEIGFSKKPLKEILNDFKSENKTKLNEHIDEFILFIDDKKDGSQLKLKRIFLSDKNLALINGFFSQLGRADSSSELKAIEGYKIKFSELYGVLSEKDKKYGNIYIKLGFLLGLAAGIIML